MKNIMLNHPHKDTQEGGIIIPTEVRWGQSGPVVLYSNHESNLYGVMPFETWRKHCVPIIFNAPEGA